MAVRKRGKTWQIDYIDPAGKRIRRAFKLKKDAEAEYGKRVSLIAEGRYLDIKKDCKTRMGELLNRYEENFKGQRSFMRWKFFYLKKFGEYFGKETLLSQIRFVDIETYRNHVRQTPVRGKAKKVRSVASVNREMAVLHHVFQKGVEWELLEKNPFDRGKGIFSKENNTRTRYLTEGEITRLLNSSPDYLKNIIICALHTGMRKSEILSLKWSQVMNGVIYLTKTKTDVSRQVPISDALAVLFKEIRRNQKPGTEHVFLYSRGVKRKEDPQPGKPKLIEFSGGSPVGRINSSFLSSLKRAGIENFRFHDLRHTCASHMVMRGASLKEVQEVLGHKTMTMTLRYAHLSQEHKKKAVNLLNGLTGNEQNDMSQNVTKPEIGALFTAKCL